MVLDDNFVMKICFHLSKAETVSSNGTLVLEKVMISCSCANEISGVDDTKQSNRISCRD